MDKKPSKMKIFLVGSVPALFITMFIDSLFSFSGDASMGPLMVGIFCFLLLSPLIGAVVLYKIKSLALKLLVIAILTFGGLFGSYIFENNCDLQIFGRENCYWGKAYYSGDISYCEKLKNSDSKHTCIYSISGQE